MAAALCLAMMVACDNEDASGEDCPSDLPDGWNCPVPLLVNSDSVELCAQIYEDPVPKVMLETDGGEALLIVEDIVFRDEQEICAYERVDGMTARVLLQPCDMHPESAIKASCVYGFTVSLGDVPQEVMQVDVLRRYDFMSDQIPPVVEVGSVSVP